MLEVHLLKWKRPFKMSQEIFVLEPVPSLATAKDLEATLCLFSLRVKELAYLRQEHSLEPAEVSNPLLIVKVICIHSGGAVLARQLHVSVCVYTETYTYTYTQRDMNRYTHTHTDIHKCTHLYIHTLHCDLMRLYHWYSKNVPQMILT